MSDKKDKLLKKSLKLLVEICETYDLSEHSTQRRLLCNEIREELGMKGIELEEEDED